MADEKQTSPEGKESPSMKDKIRRRNAKRLAPAQAGVPAQTSDLGIPSPSGRENGTLDISVSNLVEYAQNGEAGTAELFVRMHKDRFLAEKQGGRTGNKNAWYACKDGIWKCDTPQNVMESMRSLRNQYIDAADKLSGCKADLSAKAKIQILERAAARLNKHSFCANALLFAAEGESTLAFDGNRFDRTTNRIPCANGILDPAKCSVDGNGDIVLHGKAWRPLRPDDYVRNVCAAFDPKATCEKWKKFLDEVLDGDTEDGREVIDFMQCLVGYSLLGDPRQDVWVIKDSPNGRSGKGLFDKCILRVVGNPDGDHDGGLGCFTKSGLFLKKTGNDPNKPEPAIMALRNKRIVIMSEQGKGEVFDAAEVKTKTSGRDNVSARGLYGEETNFKPTYVFWQSTNALPRVSADDGAFWARLIRIKFPYHYCADPDPNNPSHRLIDTGLEERLVAETSGILNWCISGAIKYIGNGCRLPRYPRLVREAIDEYRRHEDSLEDFIESCCVVDRDLEAKSNETYETYKNWCERAGKRASSQKSFTDSMKRKGYDVTHKKNGNFFLGFGLQGG